MPSIIRATTTSGLQVAPDNSGSLQLQTNGTTTAVTIDTSQNVGIGTTSPTQKLHLYGSGVDCNQRIEAPTGTTKYVDIGTGNSGHYLYGYGNYAMYFGTNGAERMRIDSSGNVGIGTTSPVGKLSVSDGTVVGEINPYSSASGCYIGTRTNHSILFQINAAEKMRIDTNGYVTKPSQVAFNAYNASGTASNPTIFASTTLNIGSAYNTSNGRFTAPVSGRYLICTNIHGGNAAGGTADFRLQKNGSVIEGGGACRSPSYYAQATGAVVVQLSAGDYLTVLTYTNFSNTIELTYFSGYLLG